MLKLEDLFMRKRLVFRVDDIGYTPAYDMGVFKVFEAGIGSSADVMFDSPDAVEALKRLKDMPWLSVGWHRHLWESPVLPKEEVPSMTDEEGRFKWRHRHLELMDEVTYSDAYREFDAEMKLCMDVLGRYPDYATARPVKNDLEQAFKDILDKYGIVYGYFTSAPGHHMHAKADRQYEDLHIYSVNIQPEHGFNLKYFDEYDPLSVMVSPVWTEQEEIYFYGWHPGYCDDHIMKESSCNLHRCKEHEACMSDAYREWIISNQIELISMKDAIYGTNDFQEHLKEINSPLYFGTLQE